MQQLQTKPEEELTIDEYKLIASICRESFYEFVKEFWDTIIAEPFIDNWHIKFICDELQLVAERVFRREKKLYDLIFNVTPGSTKSTLCSIMAPAWIWTRMPTAKLIGGSYSGSLSLTLASLNRDVVASEKYRACFPKVIMRGDQDAKGYFMNTMGGSRYSASVGGSVTGMHGHFLFIDDPLDPKESMSEVKLATANRWMNSTISQRKIDRNVTPTILIMQRLHQNDPTQNMLTMTKDKRQIKHICIPAEVTKRVSPPELIRYYKNGLMDPVRLPREVLEQNKAYGEYHYAGQFLQWPIPFGGGTFKTDRIKVAITDESKWASRVRYWDKAGTKDAGAYTVGLLMGKDIKGRFWVIDVVRGRWDAYERETIIKRTAESDGRRVTIAEEQEPGSGGKESAEATARNLAGWKVIIDRPVGDKVQRADPFATQVNAGNVYLKPAPWNADYISELSFFPKSQYKDQTDASNGAFSFLTRTVKVGAAW